MALDKYVKEALANEVHGAKLNAEYAEDEVKRLETNLENARKLRDAAVARYNALRRYYNDNV